MKRLIQTATALAALALVSSTAHGDGPKDDDFDRLDGTGKSHKRVDVIEWEGNLEVHVYPRGSLSGLALKIDEKEGKKVMVIGYRFDVAPKEQLVRRAILGIPLHEPFQVYKDPSADDYDKVIITNNVLAGDLKKFPLDDKLKALYPDGHPALAEGKPKTYDTGAPGAHGEQGPGGRSPASGGGTINDEDFHRTGPPDGYVDEAGSIKPYSW